MFVWRKRASPGWLAANESELRRIAGNQLAVIETESAKTTLVEVADADRRKLERSRRRFGGRIVILPRDWLRNFLRLSTGKALKIGKRLKIVRSQAGLIESDRTLMIPAGAAFGGRAHHYRDVPASPRTNFPNAGARLVLDRSRNRYRHSCSGGETIRRRKSIRD